MGASQYIPLFRTNFQLLMETPSGTYKDVRSSIIRMSQLLRSLTSMFPHEARLRNLTYNSPLYCDISCKTYEADTGGRGLEEGVEAEEERENPKEFLGWVPIMLRSSFCVLVSRVLLGGVVNKFSFNPFGAYFRFVYDGI